MFQSALREATGKLGSARQCQSGFNPRPYAGAANIWNIHWLIEVSIHAPRAYATPQCHICKGMWFQSAPYAGDLEPTSMSMARGFNPPLREATPNRIVNFVHCFNPRPYARATLPS